MKRILLWIALLATLSGCQSDRSTAEGGISVPRELPEGFSEFYQRFLTDSLFQLERVLFPLQGLPDKADSATLAGNNFRWQMEDWTLHRPIRAGSDFSITFSAPTETTVQEKIRHASGRYAMERRYARFDDGWYLIYYAGLNAVE